MIKMIKMIKMKGEEQLLPVCTKTRMTRLIYTDGDGSSLKIKKIK